MSRYKILDQHGLNFVTITVVDWVDVFIRKTCKEILRKTKKHMLWYRTGVKIFTHTHLTPIKTTPPNSFNN